MTAGDSSVADFAGGPLEVAQPSRESTLAAMKAARRWLTWRLTPEGSKVPYYVSGKARGGPLDSPEDVAQLASFDEACEAIQQRQGFALGFALGPDGAGYWQGIDLDDVAANGLSDEANALPGYVEYSPSGNGAHAIGFGASFPTNLGSDGSGVEAYSSGRYFTFTGRTIKDGLVCDLSSYIRSALLRRRKVLSIRQMPTSTEHVGPLEASDIDQLRSALEHVDANTYEKWVSVGHALKTIGEVGHELWLAWSAKSPKFNLDEAQRKWASFEPQSTSYKAVFAEAQRAGWKNPGYTQNVPLLDIRLANPFARPEDDNGAPLTLGELLARAASEPDTQFTTDLLTPLGDVSLLSANGGVGKTMLCLQWGVSIAANRPFLGLNVMSVPVLYVSAEDRRQQCGKRLAVICSEMNLALPNQYTNQTHAQFHLWEMLDQPLWIADKANAAGIPTEKMAQLEKNIVATGAKQVFIDNASSVFCANHNDLAQVIGFISHLRSIAHRTQSNILLLAHVSAENATRGGLKSYYGSAGWHNSVRSRMFMELKPADGVIAEHVLVTQEKNNYAKLATPARLQRNGDTGFLRLLSHQEVARAAEDKIAAVAEQTLQDIAAIVLKGEHVNTADRGPSTAYSNLSQHFPRRYPENDHGKKHEVKMSLRKLADEGRIVRRSERMANRTLKDVWVPAPQVNSQT